MNILNPSRFVSSRVNRLSIHHLSEETVTLIYRAALIFVLATALAIATDAFSTTPNLMNVLRQASLTFLLASGLTLVILSGGFDLSIAANLTLSACLAAGVMKTQG